MVTNPESYENIIAEMKAHEGQSRRPPVLRWQGDVPAYFPVRLGDFYVSCIGQERRNPTVIPDIYFSTWPKTAGLRYGENPHQSAALYGSFNEIFRQLHGKGSFNNIVDIQSAVEPSRNFQSRRS